ncbi:MAG: hypothetical protein GY913_21485 [Proteobacteria bacterium]|nr:hypothetical protein [Actinomycetes bacterium]MCP4919482.1 hypothetical protein [Pseudomonadota bacterium]
MTNEERAADLRRRTAAVKVWAAEVIYLEEGQLRKANLVLGFSKEEANAWIWKKWGDDYEGHTIEPYLGHHEVEAGKVLRVPEPLLEELKP